MKGALVLALLLSAPAGLAAQDYDHIVVPKSMLTPEQLAKVNGKDTSNIRENVHAWAGVGKEVGEAVNSSLQAITTQTDNFAKTGVGKVTIALVVWKVLGDQLVHLLGGLIELLVFIPLWIWSYRMTCITRKFKMPDKTVQVVPYDPPRRGDVPTPRTVHTLVALGFMAVWLITIFSY